MKWQRLGELVVRTTHHYVHLPKSPTKPTWHWMTRCWGQWWCQRDFTVGQLIRRIPSGHMAELGVSSGAWHVILAMVNSMINKVDMSTDWEHYDTSSNVKCLYHKSHRAVETHGEREKKEIISWKYQSTSKTHMSWINLFNVAGMISSTWTVIRFSVAILLYSTTFHQVGASKSTLNGCLSRARNSICPCISSTTGGKSDVESASKGLENISKNSSRSEDLSFSAVMSTMFSTARQSRRKLIQGWTRNKESSSAIFCFILISTAPSISACAQKINLDPSRRCDTSLVSKARHGSFICCIVKDGRGSAFNWSYNIVTRLGSSEEACGLVVIAAISASGMAGRMWSLKGWLKTAMLVGRQLLKLLGVPVHVRILESPELVSSSDRSRPRALSPSPYETHKVIEKIPSKE